MLRPAHRLRGRAATKALIATSRFDDIAHTHAANTTLQRMTRRISSMTTTFKLNGKSVSVDADASTPLLWALRDHLGLTGTKFGCGVALCGACTVHMNGAAIRSCITPLSAVAGADVRTIEAQSADPVGRAVIEAWVSHDVAQCGYCQSGQVMSAVALLKKNRRPSDAQIDAAMAGNLCRCGTYQRIRAAIHDAARAVAA
jgi:isoquinoline 1-oxidoreductase alpha subunit